MALVLKDRVKETTTTTGTGTLTLAGAMSGFQAFSVIGNTNTTYYAIYEPSGTAWEVGIGTYTLAGTTLSRDTILASSNAGAAVNFGAGTKVVFCTYPAGKSVYLDASGNAIGLGTPAAFVATNVTGLPISTGVSGLGTGVATALAVNTGTAGAFVVNGGALGTPLSGTVTNLTGTASININGTVGATTPTTGAFTTISATGVVTVSAGSVGAPAIISTTGTADTGQWFPAADTIAWSTAGSERMRIDSAGAVGIGSTSLTGYSLLVQKNITGAVDSRAVSSTGQVQSDVTMVARNIFSTAATQAASAFTVAQIHHYMANQGTFGVGSTVSDQYGFFVNSNLIGATNNYGFYTNIASGTGRWNFYAAGTANNYFAGSVGVGNTNLTGYGLRVSKNITGAVSSFGIRVDTTVQSDVTSDGIGFNSLLATQAASFTVGALQHFSAAQGTLGASSTVTTQYGFLANSSLTGATNNYGFFGNIAAGSGRWNFYAAGTADNYFAGAVGIGATSLTGYSLRLSKNLTGAVTAFGIVLDGQIQSDVTTATYGYRTTLGTQNAVFTLPNIFHVSVEQGTFGASSTVTNQYGVIVGSNLTGATNNYGFYGNIASGTGRWNFYAAGTAANYFGGTVTIQTASATALTVGLNGATNPAFTIDSSTASQAAGFKITGAATGGTVALVATDSGSNTSLSFNAKGTGTISVGSVSTGDMIFGGSADATRRAEITTNGLATFAYGDNSLPANITLQNLGATSTTNHGSSILWRTRTDSSATAINSGRIAVIKEQLWTSTASTQDSAMVFSTTLDGSMAEKMRIGSAGAVTITSASATALTVGLNGATNPAFTIDASTASQAAGFKITGAATGGTVALVATDSGSNTSLTINAKGTGTIGIGSVSTGAVTITPATTISGVLTVSAGAVGAPAIVSATGTSDTGQWFPAADTIAWSTAGSERMRIDSSGNVGIGTNSPTVSLTVNGGAAIQSAGFPTSGAGIELSYNAGTGLASLQSYSRSASAWKDLEINALTQRFGTSGSERMRIDSSGNLLINRTSTLGNYARLEIESAYGYADLISLRQTNATAGEYVRLLVLSDTTFQISNAGYTAGVSLAYGGSSWGSISDEKLKTDLSPIQNALYKVNTLRAVTGRYKTDPEDKSRAFLIAQDVQSVLPEAVYSCMSGTNTEEKNLMLAYTDVIPLLVAALKELHEKFVLLESKVQNI